MSLQFTSSPLRLPIRSKQRFCPDNIIEERRTQHNQPISTAVQSSTASTTSCATATPISTRVLHEPSDGKPAITLTTYKHDASPSTSDSALRTIDIDPSPYVTSASARSLNSARDWVGREEPDRAQLMQDLEVHFQDLKVEFEERTGREWVPLKVWEKEEWEWDGDGEEVSLGLDEETMEL